MIRNLNYNITRKKLSIVALSFMVALSLISTVNAVGLVEDFEDWPNANNWGYNLHGVSPINIIYEAAYSGDYGLHVDGHLSYIYKSGLTLSNITVSFYLKVESQEAYYGELFEVLDSTPTSIGGFYVGDDQTFNAYSYSYNIWYLIEYSISFGVNGNLYCTVTNLDTSVKTVIIDEFGDNTGYCINVDTVWFGSLSDTVIHYHLDNIDIAAYSRVSPTPTSASMNNSGWDFITTVAPIGIIAAFGIICWRFAGVWGFFVGLNLSVALCYIVLGSQYVPMWAVIVLILVDALLLFSQMGLHK
jgi:hypothetical protein